MGFPVNVLEKCNSTGKVSSTKKSAEIRKVNYGVVAEEYVLQFAFAWAPPPWHRG